MSTQINRVSIPGFVSKNEDKSTKREISQEIKNKISSPKQPLPGTGNNLTDAQLWRLVTQQLSKVADAMSQTGKAGTETKKMMIELQKESKIKQLNKRSEELKKQEEQQKVQKGLGIFARVLGWIAAAVTAIFAPEIGIPLLITMAASEIVPTVFDDILKACNVDKDTRAKVKLGLEIAIAAIGTLITFNPIKIFNSVVSGLKSLGNGIANVAKEAISMLVELKNFISSKTMSELVSLLGSSVANKVSAAIESLNEVYKSLKSLVSTIFEAGKSAYEMAGKAFSDISDKFLNAIKAIKFAFKESEIAMAAIKEKFSAIVDSLKAAFAKISGPIKAKLNELLNNAGNAFKNLGQKFLNLPKAMFESISGKFDKIVDFFKGLRSVTSDGAIEKIKTFVSNLKSELKSFLGTYERAAAKVNQATSMAKGATDVVNEGYKIQSALIDRDLKIDSAKQEALATRIKEVILMLDEVFRTLNHSFESLFKINDANREFNRKMVSIHM